MFSCVTGSTGICAFEASETSHVMRTFHVHTQKGHASVDHKRNRSLISDYASMELKPQDVTLEVLLVFHRETTRMADCVLSTEI